MEASWRLILHGPGPPEWNMAVDQAILEAVEEGLAPPTLRLYRWNGPAVTVGRFQDVERTLRTESCRAQGIPVVRRPTGGRGVLHGWDQTVSLAVPHAVLGPGAAGVLGAYRRLTSGIALAIRRLGAAEGPWEGRSRGSAGAGDCFASTSPADVAGGPGKIAGCAQLRTRAAVLLQSSIRHRRPAVSAATLFKGPPAPAHHPLAHVNDSLLEEALVRGCEEALRNRLAEDSLGAWELERTCALMSRPGIRVC